MKTTKYLILLFLSIGLNNLFTDIDDNALVLNILPFNEAQRLDYFKDFPKTIKGYAIVKGQKQFIAALDYEYIYINMKLVEHRQSNNGNLIKKFIYNYDGNTLKSIVKDLGQRKSITEYLFNKNLLDQETIIYNGKKSNIYKYSYDSKNNLLSIVDTDYNDDGSILFSSSRIFVYDDKNRCINITEKDTQGEKIYNFKYLSKTKVEITGKHFEEDPEDSYFKATREYNNSGLLVKEIVYNPQSVGKYYEYIITYDKKNRLKTIYTLSYDTPEQRGKWQEPDHLEEFYYKD